MKQNSFLILICSAALLSACNSNTNRRDGTSDTSANVINTDTGTGNVITDTGTGRVSPVPLGDNDRSFIMDIAKGGMMEVAVSKIALAKAVNPRVKNFADMMVRDHTQLNLDLKTLASSKNAMFPDSIDADMKAHITSMQKLTGKEFDKHFMSMMKNGHKDAIDKFQKAADNAVDADVKAFASKALPLLRAHKDSADAISKGM